MNHIQLSLGKRTVVLVVLSRNMQEQNPLIQVLTERQKLQMKAIEVYCYIKGKVDDRKIEVFAFTIKVCCQVACLNFVKIFMQRSKTIFNKNIRTCERSAFDIDERENFQDIFTDTLSFLPGNIHTSENRFLMGNVYIVSLFGTHQENLVQFFNVVIRAFCNTKSLLTSRFF